jgi:acyl-CoA thioester hydrolase
MNRTHTDHSDLSEFPLVIEIPLLWGDQDSFGHVNNTVYLRWCETARVDYLIRVGLWQMLDRERVGPILAAISCDYRKPLNFPDTVRVGTRVTRIGNSSFRMEHRVISRGLGVLAAEVNSTLVVLDYSKNKPVPMPVDVRKAIEEIEGKVFEPAAR